MTDLDERIRAALADKAASIDVPDACIDQAHEPWSGARRGQSARRVLLPALAAAAVVGVVIAGVWLGTPDGSADLTASRPTAGLPATGTPYRLPSISPRPGEPFTGGSRLALFTGAFHAEFHEGAACAWIGATRLPASWPEGYAVRFGPSAELVDPAGRVVATEGDTVSASGGLLPPDRVPTGCAGPVDQAPSYTNIRVM